MHFTTTFLRRGAASKALSRGEYSRRNSVLLHEHLNRERERERKFEIDHFLLLPPSLPPSLSLLFLICLPLTSVLSDCAAVQVFSYSLQPLNYSPATVETQAVSHCHACIHLAKHMKILPSNMSHDH